MKKSILVAFLAVLTSIANAQAVTVLDKTTQQTVADVIVYDGT